MEKFRNRTLAKEYNIILDSEVEISVGTIGGFSIEVKYNSPKSFDSYLYNNEEDLNHDFELLTEMVKNNSE